MTKKNKKYLLKKLYALRLITPDDTYYFGEGKSYKQNVENIYTDRVIVNNWIKHLENLDNVVWHKSLPQALRGFNRVYAKVKNR